MANNNKTKEQLLEAERKQFMRICEYSFIPTTIVNEDETEEQPEDETLTPEQGQEEQLPPIDTNIPTGDFKNEPQEEMPEPIGNSQIDTPADIQNNTPSETDETVIDVEDLTNAQDKINKKVNSVGMDLSNVSGQLNKLMTYIQKMDNLIDQNNSKIEAFQNDLEERLPTETEKLELRVTDSNPFNVKTKDYWDNVSKKYDINGQDEKEEKEYVITDDDINQFSDASIAKTFTVSEDMKYDLTKIFNL